MVRVVDCHAGVLGSNLFLFLIFRNTLSRGLRAGLITSYCHSTRCKKKKIIDDKGSKVHIQEDKNRLKTVFIELWDVVVMRPHCHTELI